VTVRLYIRIRLSSGGRQYADPVYSANGKLKTLLCPKTTPGAYNLRSLKDGNRGYGSLSAPCQTGHEAMTLRLKRERVLEAQRVGVEVVREVEDLEFKLINSSIYKAEHGRLRMLM
jgi:hypothetical protein